MGLRQAVMLVGTSAAEAVDICSQRNFGLFLSLAGSTSEQKLFPQVHAALA